nr:putative vacuolar membrane protein [Quercus suber]
MPKPTNSSRAIDVATSAILPSDHPNLLATSHLHTPTHSNSGSPDFVHLSKDVSRQSSPFVKLAHSRHVDSHLTTQDDRQIRVNEINDGDEESFSDWDDQEEEEGVGSEMPSDLRPPKTHRTSASPSHSPLLAQGDRTSDDLEARSGLVARRSTQRLKERDPEELAKAATKKRYTYAAAFLGLSLISFAVQTETAVYIQHNLHWNKAYCMLYFTHGSWSLLWPFQLLILRLQKWQQPWPAFWRRHTTLLRQTGQMVEHQTLHIDHHLQKKSPIPYFIRTTAFVTCALTVAGGSWYVAVDLTTASDLTAIYNCSAFFAYAFAVPMLHEKLRISKVVAVAIAIVGVLVVAYGDQGTPKHGSKSGGGSGGPHAPDDNSATSRTIGNIVIGIGSVLYGFYEVLYKKVACPPEGTSPGRGMIFANAFGSMIGLFTLSVLWIPIPILHITGIETFALPRGEAAWMLLISVLANATFSGSFLVLISLTSPVLSSVAALLTIFLVALCDQMLPPPLYQPLTAAAIAGGVLIIFAFGLLSWTTYREMGEEQLHNRKPEEERVDESDLDEDDF